jgi:hypothetical protein
MENISIYPDGSGNSVVQLEQAKAVISKKKQQITLMESFIEKYQNILAGVGWDANLWNCPEIKIYCGGQVGYRGEYITPKELIRKLFPLEYWERVEQDFHEGRYNYEATINGVLVKLESAEVDPKAKRYKPKRMKLSL